jgi:hypothetical protein
MDVDPATLFDHQHSPLLAAVERIHGRKEPGSLNQPGLKLAIDIKHEDQIFGFQEAVDR